MKPMQLGVVGCGHIATQQVAEWVECGKAAVLVGVEPDVEQFARFAISVRGEPEKASSLDAMLRIYGPMLDAVYIATPHAFHGLQTVAALNAGLNVLLEKPMSFKLKEARSIEAAVQRSGRHLVIAFNGSLSPILRATSDAVASGVYGKLLALSGVVSEDWSALYKGHWKQESEISGGGFLLDTGSHALNAILDLANCGIDTLSAQFTGEKPTVELVASISGRMQNGALISLLACGDTSPPCQGEITVFCEKAILRVDPWGQRETTVCHKPGGEEHVLAADSSRSLIDVFTDICAGRMVNPSPASRNVEFARLWESAFRSASLGGQLQHVSQSGIVNE